MEYFGEKVRNKFQFFATDISTKVLNKAIKGVYYKDSCKNISLSLLKKYFQKGSGTFDGYYKVKEKYSKLIDFKRLNFMESFNFTNKFDLIFCRNVMIYFNKKTQEILVNKFWNSLKDDGYFFIGHSESLMSIQNEFKYIAPTIYQK
jgi:chemotaxis protein methyltransferase CheR